MNSTANFTNNPLNKIIGLSVILSVGFLLVVLAGINGNWFPIIDGFIFAVAYLPVKITQTMASLSDYDFNFDPSFSSRFAAAQELGKFVTGALVVTGFYLPILLQHSHILSHTSVVLTLVGGLLILGTVYTFSRAFDAQDNAEEGLGGVI